MKALTLVLLGAAAFAREPKAAHPAVPERFSETAAGVSTEPVEVSRWWTEFHDPVLNQIVEQALRNNRDIRAAAARVAEARALTGVAKSSLLPGVGSNTSFNRIRGGFAQGIIKTQNGQLITPFETPNYQQGFDARWELDLFGGNRRGVEASKADAVAAQHGQDAAALMVAGEIAREYFLLRGLTERLAIARRNIESQKDELALTRARAEAGLGTQLDVERQNAQLASTQAVEPALESAREAALNRIAVLCGEPPSAMSGLLLGSANSASIPPVLPAGLPSQLLSRRPDLRQAEAQMAAASARVGQARADLFPKFVIQGLTGRQATGFDGFTLGAGNFFSVGPGVTLPIFQGGRIRANIAARDAAADEAIARYEGAVLAATEEVENAIAAYGREQQRRDRLTSAVQSNRAAVDMANELYTRGLGDFLAVLDAQRALFAAEDDLQQSDTAVFVDAVALFKALGGGWN